MNISYKMNSTAPIPPPPPPPGELAADLGAAIYNFAVSPITLVANFLLVLTLLRDPYKCFCTPSSYFLLAMATANVITGSVAQPMFGTIHLWLYMGKGLDTLARLEKAAVSVSLFSLNLSFIMVFALAFDSYLAISRPIQHKVWITGLRAKLLIAAVFLYAVIFALLPYFGLSREIVLAIDLYLNSTFISVLLILSYILLFMAFHAQAKQSIRLRKDALGNRSGNENVTKVLNDKKRFHKRLLVFVFLFTVPSILSTIGWYLSLYCIKCTEEQYQNEVAIINLVLFNLIFLKPAADPFVFAWRISRYRRSLRETVLCHSRRVVAQQQSLRLTTHFISTGTFGHDSFRASTQE